MRINQAIEEQGGNIVHIAQNFDRSGIQYVHNSQSRESIQSILRDGAPASNHCINEMLGDEYLESCFARSDIFSK